MDEAHGVAGRDERCWTCWFAGTHETPADMKQLILGAAVFFGVHSISLLALEAGAIASLIVWARAPGRAFTRVVVMYEHVTARGTRMAVGGIHTSQRGDGVADEKLRIARAGLITSIQSDGRFLGLRRPSITATFGRYLRDPSKKDEWSATLSVATTLRRK